MSLLLIDLTLRTSVIVLVGLAASVLLRHRSAALRHAVLATALLAAAIVLPLRLVLPAWDVHVPMLPFAIGAAASASGSATAGHDAHARRGSVTPSASADSASRPGAASATDTAATGAAHLASSSSAAAARASEPAGRLASALRLAVIVWAIGAVAGAATLLLGIARLVRVGSRAARVRDGRWAHVAAQVADAYGLQRRVTLLQTDVTDVLATWGVRRPRILLPAHARDWSADRIRVVLGHEIAHIRRRDWAIQIGAEILRTIYWFNPLLWLACARLRRDSEQACDDDVLRMGVRGDDYAEHLLEVARSCRGWGPTPAAVVPMARPSTLERRIAAMLNPGLDRKALSSRALALSGVLLLAITMPMAALRAAQDGPRTLEGAVYDPSGGLMPGVSLTLTSAQETKLVAETDATGRFRFDAVPPGDYVLEATVEGFRPLRHRIALRNAADWDRAVMLEVGQLNEVITVQAARVAGARPSSAVLTPGPVRIGGSLKQPSKIAHTPPVYPEAMREAGREGVVPMEAIIGRDGAVTSVRVLSAQIHPDFAIAAVDAVRQWRYVPTLLNGKPIEVAVTVTVTFNLSDLAPR